MSSSLKPSVILLNNDQEYLVAATEVLVDMGYPVHAMQSPIETINVIHGLNGPAIILLDYAMIDMDPRRFMGYVNQISRFDLFPILVTDNITSPEKREMYENALSDGIRMHFGKTLLVPGSDEPTYDLGTLYRRVITTAEEILEKLTASKKDPLTDLPNRLGGFEQWEGEWNRSMRNKGPISFALLDFNGMKITNDTYGHAAGDLLIKKFAAKLKESLRTRELRTSDIVIRWGGDEFLIIMINTNRQKAYTAIDRLKKLFNETQFEVAEGIYIPVLFCAGIVTHTGRYAEDTARSVFEEKAALADKALYEEKAKNPKRNDGYSK